MSPDLQNIDELEIEADQVVIRDGKIIAEEVEMLPLIKKIFETECADDLAKNIMDLLNHENQVDFVAAVISKYGKDRTLELIKDNPRTIR